MSSYFVIKTTRSPDSLFSKPIGTYRKIPIQACMEHESGCIGIRWITDNVVHELHAVQTNGATVPNTGIPPSVYSTHKGEGGSVHNYYWCRRYCGGRPPSELNERLSR